MHVGGRKRSAARALAGWKVEELRPCRPRGVSQLRKLRTARAGADDQHEQVVEVSSRVVARRSVSRSCAWPTLPECMTTKRSAIPFSDDHGFTFGCGESADSRSSWDHTQTVRPCALCFQTPTHDFADRDDPIGTAEIVRTRRRRSWTSGPFSRRFSATAASGNTSSLITTSGARCLRATASATLPIIGGSVPHTTTSGRGRARAVRRAAARYVT